MSFSALPAELLLAIFQHLPRPWTMRLVCQCWASLIAQEFPVTVKEKNLALAHEKLLVRTVIFRDRYLDLLPFHKLRNIYFRENNDGRPNYVVVPPQVTYLRANILEPHPSYINLRSLEVTYLKKGQWSCLRNLDTLTCGIRCQNFMQTPLPHLTQLRFTWVEGGRLDDGPAPFIFSRPENFPSLRIISGYPIATGLKNLTTLEEISIYLPWDSLPEVKDPQSVFSFGSLPRLRQITISSEHLKIVEHFTPNTVVPVLEEFSHHYRNQPL